LSDQRYQADIKRGIAGALEPRDWPEEIPGIGKLRGGQPYPECVDCPSTAHARTRRTWRAYGDTPLCHNHALARARAAGVKVAA
jgi:hypothetical protein